MATTAFLMILLVNAVANTIVNKKSKQMTDPTYNWTTPAVTSTVNPSHTTTNEFYQDFLTTYKWSELTEPETYVLNWTSTTLLPSIEYETSTSSNRAVNTTGYFTDKWTNISLPTTNSLSIGVPVVMLGVGTVVMVVNVLVMVAYVRNYDLRHNTNHNLVMGLTLSDFLQGFTSFIVGCRLLFPTFSGELVLCILENISGITSLVMSLFQTFCISLHRFLVLSENVWAQRLFDKNRKYIIYIVSWTTAFSLFSSLISPDLTKLKTYSKVFGPNKDIVRLILCSLNQALMALTLIFYALTIYQVKKRYMNMSSGSNAGNMEKIKQKRIIKSMKLVSKILLVLFLCSGPFSFSLMFENNHYAVSLVAFVGANLNSLLNPLIYWSHASQLRNEVKKIFLCKN